MWVEFQKYHGAGNDFIMIDCRNYPEGIFTPVIVNHLCDRHFGIGSDGLILLLNDKAGLDFKMKYFNSDGNEGTMCGNGGRCITAFAKNLGVCGDQAVFSGIDGLHHARIISPENINLKMIDVSGISLNDDGYLLETGSSHLVIFKENLKDLDVVNLGRQIRNKEKYGMEGINVNFIRMQDPETILIRTYERGVEDETLACGTGSVASAISAYFSGKSDKVTYSVITRGGRLKVSFTPDQGNVYKNVWLEGPVKYVFSGKFEI